MDEKEVKNKVARYCAYQERSQKEVRQKIYDLGLFGDEAEALIVEMIQENYLNEERFARTFAGGKFRIKKWGRNKIKMALTQYDVSEYCVKAGLSEIDEGEYLDCMEQIILRKNRELNEENLFKKRDKISRHLIYKGFEPELVWSYLKKHIL